MSILATHMVGSDDNLYDICVDGLSAQIISITEGDWWMGRCTYEPPSPSSLGSDETSKVIQPSGLSRVTTRTSCKSLGPVPARIARVDGVYESS